MSIHILTITPGGKDLIWVSDKRSSLAKDLSFVDDEAIKIHEIREDLYLSPGSYHDLEEGYLNQIMPFKQAPASKIIEIVQGIDRRFKNREGEETHSGMILAGLHDSGNFFMLLCQDDGTTDLKFAHDSDFKLAITTHGNDLVAKAFEFIKDKLAINPLLAMAETIKFISTIEKTVSPTSHYLHMKKANNLWQQEENGQLGHSKSN